MENTEKKQKPRPKDIHDHALFGIEWNGGLLPADEV
jgi:hypothetical protein